MAYFVIISTILSISAIVLCFKLNTQLTKHEHLFKIYGEIIRELPGAQDIIERKLQEYQAGLVVIEAAIKKLNQTFREKLPF